MKSVVKKILKIKKILNVLKNTDCTGYPKPNTQKKMSRESDRGVPPVHRQ